MAQILEESLINEDLSDIYEFKKKLDKEFYVVLNQELFNKYVDYTLTAKKEGINYTISCDLNENKIIQLSYSLSKCNSIENMGRLNYYFIDKYVTKIKSLKSLILDHNKIDEIPESIEKLSNLTYLSFFDNNLSELPDSIVNLKNLGVLCLEENNITNLPKNIGYLNNLEILHLRNNKLKRLPNSMENLSNLTLLGLDNNKLKYFPKTILKLKKLKNLELSNNKIEYIPKGINNLELLDNLHLKNNKIKKLPVEIGDLKNLKYLYLSKNKLKAIPESLCDLIIKNNINIFLDNNQFAKIKGIEKYYTYLGDTQMYIILNSNSLYLDEIGLDFDKDFIKNISKLEINEVEKIIKDNKDKLGLIEICNNEITPDYYLNIINQLISEESNAKKNNLNISRKNNKIIKKIFDICPKLKALSGKDIGKVRNSEGFDIIL